MESPHSTNIPLDSNESEQKLSSNTAFHLFLKLFVYEGIVVLLPFLIIQMLKPSNPPITDQGKYLALWLELLTFLILLIMDNYALNAYFLDRHRLLITVGLCIFGLLSLIFLVIFTWNVWDNSNLLVIIFSMLSLMSFQFLGWFYVRGDHAFTLKKTPPSYIQSAIAFFICGLNFLAELAFPHGLLIGLIVLYALFPLALIRYKTAAIVPRVKPDKIISKYDRLTIWNFGIDMIKAAGIVFAFLLFLYNGDIVLYPDPNIFGIDAWRQHLAVVGFVAAFAMLLYERMQRMFSLSVIILIMVLNVVSGIFAYFGAFTFRWIIGIINGFSLAGIYYYIEQKIESATNIRALPGSFYVIIFAVIVFGLLIRGDEISNSFLESAKSLGALMGLAYIVGYLRAEMKPKSFVMSVRN